VNQYGDIYTLVYGCIPALSYNPIEKKPFYHFYPGTLAITIGTYGCNFDCCWCQNNHISHPSHPILEKITQEKRFLPPERVVELALLNDCKGTSISFNEPTLLFEYSLDVFRLARKEGLYNTYVSNGYMTEEVLKELVKYGLNAINIDIKADAEIVKKYCGADDELVWRNAILAKELGIHVEITTLLIESLNSEKDIIHQISKRIYDDLGELTPFHITRFFPLYKSKEYGFIRPTPIELLKNAFEIAKHNGLKYIYLGNVSTSTYNHTVCPNCFKIVIKRVPLGIEEHGLDLEGKCKECGFEICKMS